LTRLRLSGGLVVRQPSGAMAGVGALVDSLVISGHPSTPGYRDPMEPQEGRVVLRG
jgi:hypothetical protein